MSAQMQMDFTPKRRSFHNTTREPDASARTYEAVAKAQDERIFSFFCEFPNESWTAWDIKGEPKFDHIMITSIRRSLDTLKNQGFIECTGKKKHFTGRNSLAYKFKSPLREQPLNK